MKLPWSKNSKTVKIQYPVSATSQNIIEKVKGLVKRNEIKFPKELGEEHPFNYQNVDTLVKRFGILQAIIDKHVDFMFSGGINIKSEDERAQQVIENFMEDFDFLNWAITWVRQGLKLGFSPMELSYEQNGNIDDMKLLDSNYMYVKRDKLGKIEKYNQFTKPLKQFNNSSGDDITEFNPDEIASLSYNVFGDNFYGQGLIFPLMSLIDQLLSSRANMHLLMRRKSNSPIILTMGSEKLQEEPDETQIQSLGKDLEWMNNKHEWVFPWTIKASTLDFGNLGDKFEFIIENDMEMLFMAAQVPAVLMGKGSIPEGLAKVQMKAWELRIQTLREITEKVIEQQIFKRVLNANGLDAHVEVIWGLPTQEDKNEKAIMLKEIIKVPFISENLRYQLELQIAEALDIPPEELETPEEEREREETDERQPIVPEQRKAEPITKPRSNGDADGAPIEHVCTNNKCKTCAEKYNEENDNLTVKEFIGFSYDEYNQDVIDITNKDKFELLRGITKSELEAGLLSVEEIDKLRTTMVEGFDKNLTIRLIENLLNKRINFRNRYRMKDGKIVLKKNGERALASVSNKRAIMIARSETVRLSNLGALENYKKGGIKKVRWISALSDRTCEQCEALNGMVIEINKVTVKPPLHVFCRCTLSPVVE